MQYDDDSIMQDKKNIHSRSSRITIRILAVAFWLLVWQIGSMWLGQEILLASPVSVARKLSELLVTQEFWEICLVQFWKDYRRISKRSGDRGLSGNPVLSL